MHHTPTSRARVRNTMSLPPLTFRKWQCKASELVEHPQTLTVIGNTCFCNWLHLTQSPKSTFEMCLFRLFLNQEFPELDPLIRQGEKLWWEDSGPRPDWWLRICALFSPLSYYSNIGCLLGTWNTQYRLHPQHDRDRCLEKELRRLSLRKHHSASYKTPFPQFLIWWLFSWLWNSLTNTTPWSATQNLPLLELMLEKDLDESLKSRDMSW